MKRKGERSSDTKPAEAVKGGSNDVDYHCIDGNLWMHTANAAPEARASAASGDAIRPVR